MIVRPIEKFAILLMLIVVLAPAALLAADAKPARPDKWQDMPLNDQIVDKAIADAVAFIWSKQDKKEFHWETTKIDDFAKAWKKKDDLMKQWQRASYVHDLADYGGRTALALLALHKAGVDRNEPRFVKGIAFLKEIPAVATYPNAIRSILFASLEHGHQKEIEDEKKWLLSAIYASGGTGYLPPHTEKLRMNPKPNTCDMSNAQYAVLAAWALDDAGAEIPDKYWQLVQKFLLDLQSKTGGWGYRNSSEKGYGTMTMAGLASQFIVWDKLYARQCGRMPSDELLTSINNGLAWVNKNFRVDRNPGHDNEKYWLAYNLYGVERVGVASGLKYFGDHNWYVEGAKYVLWCQKDDGSFFLAPSGMYHRNAIDDTAYVLMFLAYGRAPVIFNKLAYDKPSQWNVHPRDLARLTTWMGKTYERLFNWQIAPIDRSVEELLDAPILVMSGRGSIDLDDEQKQKLKDYILGGGLLFGEPIDNNMVFIGSFKRLLAELFGELELTVLPDDHPLYTVHPKLRDSAPGRMPCPKLMGIGNGIRTLAILSPQELGCVWQQYNVVRGESYFRLGGNLMLYVSDKGSGLIGRGASYAVADAGNKPADTITVGRVTWGGKFNWDPEPAAWKHADIRLRNDKVMTVVTKELDFAQPVAAADVPIVHLTGVGEVKLTDDQKKNLKAYVAGGGLLLADAAGGDSRFAESFQKLAGELFGNLVPAVPPFLKDATDGGKVTMRHVGGLPRSSRSIELLGVQTDGRWSVLFLPHDLTAALVGYANVEPVGLTPESAQQFVTELLKWRRAAK